MRANQESRKTAAKVYTASFPTLRSKPQVYFNFEIDTLYLDTTSFVHEYSYDYRHIEGSLTYFCPDERPRLWNIALHIDLFDDLLDVDASVKFCELLGCFVNISKATFVVGEYMNTH